MWSHWVDNISVSRNITQEKFNLIVDNLYSLNINKAMDYGLIDNLTYEDELINLLKKTTERKEDEDLRSVSLSKYAKAPKPRKEDDEEKGLADDEIAVIFASGQITAGNGRPADGIAGKRYASIIRDARKDEDIKAIVLRVNSPGGSALGSDLIWREVKLAHQEKPVIVSMGDLAASGGYYISCAADTIVASENTITGSIGVFGLMFNAKELLNEKLGITSDNVKTNKYADLGSATRAMTSDEKAILQQNIERIYSSFISKVASGRGMTVEQVDSIGQGRVWSGKNALEMGLVDEFGGMTRAVEIAAEKAGLDRYRLTELPKPRDPIQEFLKQMTGGDFSSVLKQETGRFYYYLDAMRTISEMETIQARLPYKLRIE